MLQVERLHVEYATEAGSHVAVQDESFDVRPGEFFTLLGPSGCGKTTTLRSIAGLETPTSGVIRIDGDAVFDSADRINLATHARDISMVFQSYAIWPHMSVIENVAFPLEVNRQTRASSRERARQTLEMVGLGELADRPATQLSGGQQQRVALARAIVKQAKLLLLDEPLSNLDAKLREQMRRELRLLQQNLRTTSVYVTHDQDEALSLSDRIAVMQGGRIVEIGTPTDLYLRPRHEFTARFVGLADLVPCRFDAMQGSAAMVTGPFGTIQADVHADLRATARHLLIRPEHVEISVDQPPGPNVYRAQLCARLFSGRIIEYDARVNDHPLTIQTTSANLFDVPGDVWVRLPPNHCVLLAPETGDHR